MGVDRRDMHKTPMTASVSSVMDLTVTIKYMIQMGMAFKLRVGTLGENVQAL